MPAVRNTPVLRAIWRFHRALLRISGGRVGKAVGPMRVLLLETTGRKSGEPRRVGLSYVEDAGRFYVAGSFAGEDRDPDALNLRATPSARVTIDGRSFAVRARALAGEERGAMFDRFVAGDASYGEYRDRTDRVIPVFELVPEA
ncbi:MAG TPA: nitroreductase/quinone reductase family protein [Actinomycetota bacterium]|nr:nitroreductase/quinone reductase family protein [Actinomycetota bacterium]